MQKSKINIKLECRRGRPLENGFFKIWLQMGAAPTRRPAGLERAGKRAFSFRLLCCVFDTAGAARQCRVPIKGFTEMALNANKKHCPSTLPTAAHGGILTFPFPRKSPAFCKPFPSPEKFFWVEGVQGEAGIFFQEKPASPLHILLPKSSFRGGESLRGAGTFSFKKSPRPLADLTPF